MLLIVVLEGREKTMCDLRFWLLRELGVEAPATARAVQFRGALLLGIVGLNDGFFVTCLFLCFIVLLIVVLEGREKTICDLRFWLLRELGVEAPATARSAKFRRALLVGIVGLNDGFFCHMFASVVYCVADCCAGGQSENHV